MTSRWALACESECSYTDSRWGGANSTISSARRRGKGKKHPLQGGEAPPPPRLYTALSESKGGGVLRIDQRRPLVYGAGELVQDDDECEPRTRRVRPPVELPPSGLFEDGGEQPGYLF